MSAKLIEAWRGRIPTTGPLPDKTWFMSPTAEARRIHRFVDTPVEQPSPGVEKIDDSEMANAPTEPPVQRADEIDRVRPRPRVSGRDKHCQTCGRISEKGNGKCSRCAIQCK